MIGMYVHVHCYKIACLGCYRHFYCEIKLIAQRKRDQGTLLFAFKGRK